MSTHNAREIMIDREVNSSILPSKREDLMNNVILREGYHVRGGIYCSDLQAFGGGIVEGPVMAHNEAVLQPDPSAANPMIFACGLNANRAVQVRYSSPPKSPIDECYQNPLVIRGDVNSESVKLESVLMMGNIYCTDGYIKDSIVFGIVHAERELKVENSVLISFRSKARTELIGNNTLIIPYATSGSDVVFASSAQGKARLRYMGGCPDKPECSSPLDCKRYYQGECDFMDNLFANGDVFDARALGLAEDIHERILTMVPRITDTRPIKKQVDELTLFIRALNHLPHLDEQARREIEEKFRHNADLHHCIKTFLYCTYAPDGKIDSYSSDARRQVWKRPEKVLEQRV